MDKEGNGKTTYTVIAMRASISRANRDALDWNTPAFTKRVKATRPSGAVQACADEIWAMVDADIQVVSCYVGTRKVSELPTRMSPIQIWR